MKTLIIYGTQYGSTTSYAERLAKKTGIEAVDYKDAKKIHILLNMNNLVDNLTELLKNV